MRDFFLRAILGGLTLGSASAWGQMHKVAKPEQVVRAVGVYEWTGDMAKPTASRLIPVSIFIEGKLEDAGVYVARPVPFALLTGNIYELQAAGIDRGFLDLAYARHVQTDDGAFDDGWFGYGSFKPLTAAKKSIALRPSKTLPALTSSKDSARPHLDSKTSDSAPATSGADQTKTASKSDSSTTSGTPSASTADSDRPTMKRRSSDSTTDTTASSGSTSTDTAKSTGGTSSDDPDRPTMKRRSSGDGSDSTTDSTASNNTTAKSSGSAPADDPDRPTMKRREGSEDTTASSGSTTDDSSAKSTGSAPADDPDRPTMKRRSSDTSTDTTASTTGTGNTPADDPDRPTLKRHSAEDAKKAQSGQNDVAMSTGVGSLNDDPDRPNLHHGKPVGGPMAETDLPKLVGLPPDSRQMVAVSDAVNRDPHEFARDWQDPTEHAAVLEKMQGMARAQLATYGATTPPPATPAVKKTSTAKPRRSTPPVAASEPLLDEELKAYTLSYGGAATYVYMAHTAGTGAKLRYVTVVAQADGLGELKPAIQSVTDAAHLDRTPRMKFVDVVDAEASNRASLLFELRGQSARQFGLYRVIAARSEQIFLTGTTQ